MKNNICHNRHPQKGLTLIILVLLLIIVGSATYIAQLNANNIQAMRAEKTAKALMEAKKALLGYAVTVNLKVLASDPCPIACRRPGDLPCPDTNSDGEADTSCDDAEERLGRLPWKTLGLGDLRDGNGDRLWYAVSNNFKNNPKVMPLNNNSLGTIHITDFGGLVSANATGSTGAVAVIFSTGTPLTRQDGIQQIRSDTNANIASHYLDNALGEDNADFLDSTANGFVKGVVRDAAGDIILNDQLLVISQKDIFNAIDTKVLKEVKLALTTFYIAYNYYPMPASFADTNCLDTTTVAACNSGLLNEGRIPATGWVATSILRAESNNNWFQQNEWREHVYYAVSPACTLPLFPNCTGIGTALTLNGAVNGATSKNMILLMAGPSLSGQSRGTNLQKIVQSNYYELENATLLDGIYQRTIPLTITFNDSVESIP
ncbi:MAG TPA: hypothetical protein VES38_03205 [Methylotenera sp.]|nr:hypothetical protein [Methylotenera sp.]